MRYGSTRHRGWYLEFHFNWKENKYNVLAAQESSINNIDSAEGIVIGLVWKNPKKSRQKPCWEAFLPNGCGDHTWYTDTELLRTAAIALLEHYLSQSGPDGTDRE